MASKKSPEKTPAKIRREIQTLDQSILSAVVSRLKLVQELARKQPTAAPSDDFLSKAASSTKEMDTTDAKLLLQQIDSYCQGQTQSQKVCYLGPKYSYSYLAATRYFGTFHDLHPVQNIGAVFSSVASGDSKFGVVPIENSTDGRIADTLTMFSQHSVAIYREVHLPINHCLIGKGRIQDIKEIRSKSQALSQCRNWIDKTFSDKVKRVTTNSSSDAALDAVKGGKSIAAIASRDAANGLNLKVIKSNIENQKGNLTRFAVIVQPENPDIELPRKSGKDKSSIMFAIPHRPGSLADVINVFKRSKLNLTWIESFPKPGVFSEYTFFAEFQGHRDEIKVRNAMANLEKKTEEITFLGSYPEFCAT
jgi:chorismate mutase/prephenate dehydratase